MKRIALALLLIFPTLKYIAAQGFQAGFYLGATASDVAGTNNINNSANFSKLGFTLAGTVCTNITPKTKLQMEIRFYQRGAQIRPTIDSVSTGNSGTQTNGNYNVGYNDYFTMTLNYVDIVVGIKHQIHFNIRNASTDRYGIEAGVSIGTLIYSSYEVNSVSYPLDVNGVDISPYVGLYYNITPHFYIEGRYSNSVNSVLKHDNTNGNSFYNLYYGTWDSGHNRGFSMTVGFVFGNGSAGDQANSSSSHDTPPPSSDSQDN